MQKAHQEDSLITVDLREHLCDHTHIIMYDILVSAWVCLFV